MSYQTSAQTYIPEKIKIKKASTELGFDINFTWTIFQDRRGFLWIGTSGELLRYDGLRFKAYRNEHENVHSLAANTVRVIYEDKSGIIWIGTGGGGLNKFNYDKENFTRYVHNPDDSTSISANYIYSIFEDKSGKLWIGTESGLNFFNRSTEKFRSYKNIPGDTTSLSSNLVTAVFEDSRSNLWIGTIDGGLNLFDRNSGNFIRFMHNPEDLRSLSHNKVTGICEDKFGNVWVSTLGGGLNKIVYRDNTRTPSFINFKNVPDDPTSLSDNDIASFYIDKNNTMWLATWGGGLNRMISSLKDSHLSFISFKNDPDDPAGLSSNNVSTIYQDNSGILWIGTWGGSINLINLKQKQFRHYNRKKNNPNSLSANGIMSIFEDKTGIIWIGTWDGGLNRWDRSTNKFTHYKHNAGNQFSLSDNSVSTIYEDRDGDFWIGTWNGGLNKFDRAAGKFYHFNHNLKNLSSISDNRILSIAEDDSGMLWIGTYYGGLNKFDKNTGRFAHYKNDPDNPNSLNSTDVHSLLIDNFGILWIGTKHGGVQSLDLKSEKFSFYKNIPGDINTISNDKISALYQDKSGTLWIGTQDGGLNKFDKEKGKFKNFRMSNGLAHNFVMGILEDDCGNLWISTSNGLSKFNIANETFRNYYVEDGLQDNEFEELSAYCKTRTGELIFGGINGFNIFYPDSIKDNTHIPPVYITDFNLFNKPVSIGYDSLSGRTILKKSIVDCEEIELNHSDNVFSFGFAALDFQAPNKNKYAYIMEGFDKDWTYIDAGNASATYTNLDPGEYIFRVKGSNNDGYWNEKGKSIKVIILPPWWWTNLAYLIYVLLTGSIIYFIWKAQLKRIRNKHEYEMSRFEAQKLQEVDKMKTRFFTNISHEFRTPLTLILGPSKQLAASSNEEKTKATADLIHRNAKKLNKLVDELLDIAKIETGEMKLKASPLNIVALTKETALSFYSLAERKRITFNLISEQGEISVYVDKEKVDKILTNLLSNAFKFTPDNGKISVTIKRSKRDCEIAVADSGTGIPQNELDKIFDRFYQVDGSHTREYEGTGIGLSLTKELVELHKGQIKVESQEGKGSVFHLIFPLGKEHLKPEEIFEKLEAEKEVKTASDLVEEFSTTLKHTSDFPLTEEAELPTLLIVEDNLDVRTYITNILSNHYKICEAEDGEEGIEKSFKHIPDLIITDVMMPKMDGFQLCSKLKSDFRTSHIPVIMLTAKATMNDKITGLGLGADDYIMKPFEAEELKARIKNLLEQRIRLHDHFRKFGYIEKARENISSADELFIQKTISEINKNLSDSSFGIEQLAEKLAVSRALLFKKMNHLTGEPPGEIIKRMRLNKAAILIEKNSGNISEVALEVGFNNPSYFSECFKKQFGVLPSQYHQNKQFS